MKDTPHKTTRFCVGQSRINTETNILYCTSTSHWTVKSRMGINIKYYFTQINLSYINKPNTQKFLGGKF